MRAGDEGENRRRGGQLGLAEVGKDEVKRGQPRHLRTQNHLCPTSRLSEKTGTGCVHTPRIGGQDERMTPSPKVETLAFLDKNIQCTNIFS